MLLSLDLGSSFSVIPSCTLASALKVRALQMQLRSQRMTFQRDTFAMFDWLGLGGHRPSMIDGI